MVPSDATGPGDGGRSGTDSGDRTPPSDATSSTDGTPADDGTPTDDGTRADDARTARTRSTATHVVAGALGGLAGAAVFGALMWTQDPAFLRASIPSLFGLEPRSAVGWAVHLGVGVLLGVVFAAIVSRDVVREVLAPTETEPLGPLGLGARLVGAGLAFGIAVWAIIPLLVLPAVTTVAGDERFVALSISGTESLLGHALYGLVLGVVYAAIVAR